MLPSIQDRHWQIFGELKSNFCLLKYLNLDAMSTAVKNEYAVDHTDGLPGLPSWQTFKDKILPKGSKDRFEWMRDEHAAHIKSLHEQYGKQIKEKEETIAWWRERVLKLENGDTFKAKEEQLKQQEQLNSDLSVKLEELTTEFNNMQSNFKDLEKENHAFRHDLKMGEQSFRRLQNQSNEKDKLIQELKNANRTGFSDEPAPISLDEFRSLLTSIKGLERTVINLGYLKKPRDVPERTLLALYTRLKEDEVLSAIGSRFEEIDKLRYAAVGNEQEMSAELSLCREQYYDLKKLKTHLHHCIIDEIKEPVGECSLCNEDYYFYGDFRCCENKHAICIKCFENWKKKKESQVREPPTYDQNINNCPKCRSKVVGLKVKVPLEAFLVRTKPISEKDFDIGQKMVSLFGRFKELNAPNALL